MRVFKIFAIILALASLSGCYIGAETLGEAGVYYTPPYYRRPIAPTTYWIEAAPVTYASAPERYPFWY